MLDRIINILIIENDEEGRTSLLSVIQKPSHNIFSAITSKEAFQLLEDKNFALIICSLDLPDIDSTVFLNAIHKKNATKNATIIVSSSNREKVYAAVDENDGQNAMDYLMKPYIPNLVKTKIAVYKRLFFKHLHVARLLESILPAQTLDEFSLFGKSSPKKKKNCTVLFTDFVNFTKKTKDSDPQEIVKQLDFYFSKFDEIILKYRLEKIKTIGDAYMAVGGVTESDPNPSVRMALAAIEIRNFMLNDMLTHKALNNDFWQIRIGIHSGDLVAGVVGTHKFSFDVWGDTVNIAARCEQNSIPSKINISDSYAAEIETFFNSSPRGKITIKNRGEIGMFFLNEIKPEYSLDNKGKIANVKLRKQIGLPLADFHGLRNFILLKLKAELDEKLHYHSVEHTLNVEEAVIKYGELENLNDYELFLVKTAALFHDTGFLFSYKNNENLAVDLFRHHAPKFGYQKKDIKTIEEIILSTVQGIEPKNLMESIMCDADLDYLGRLDYHTTAAKLYAEMKLNGIIVSKYEWLKMQLDYLENQHLFYTTSAKNLRDPGKVRRIIELKKLLVVSV